MYSGEKDINKGIEYLNETCPEWINVIDLEKLDLSNCERCILGQLYGSYLSAVKVLDLDPHETANMGFSLRGYDYPFYNYNDLTRVWKRLIKEIREKKKNT